MAKPNYQFEKRQRDIAKKKKQDEKRSKKLGKDESGVAGEADADTADVAIPSADGSSPA
jgi:hypothetical protein